MLRGCAASRCTHVRCCQMDSGQRLQGEVLESYARGGATRAMLTQRSVLTAFMLAPVPDQMIVREFLAWHEKKLRFPTQRLLAALKWMRQHRLVPEGGGRRSTPS